MRAILLVLLLTISGNAEDMLSRQSGQAIPPGVWTQLTSIGGIGSPVFLGYDNFTYNTFTGKLYAYEKYKDPSSEFNQSLFSYSADKNRWDLVDRGSFFHNPYMPESGHLDNRLTTDPTTGFLWALNGGGSGSQGADFTFGNWQYDPLGQSGRITHPLTRSFVLSAEISARVDYTRGVILQHGTGGTQEFNILNNTWGATYCASGGGCPPANVQEACLEFNKNDKSSYLFGGIVSGTGQNTLYKNTAGTWSVVSTSGTPPSIRAWSGCAIDWKHNIMLVAGGCTAGTGCSSGNLSDTFLLDLSTVTWSAGPALPTPDGLTQQVANRLVYDERMDAFIVGITDTGVSQLWALRLYSGQNFGYRTGDQYTQAAGAISINATGYAKDPTLAVNGSEVLVGWGETGIPSDTSSGSNEYPYAANIVTGSVVLLPPSVTPLMATSTNSVSNDITCTFVAGVKWCAWTVRSGSITAKIYTAFYNGTAWSTPQAIGLVNVGGGSAVQGHSIILDVNSVPTLVFEELDKILGSPYRNFVYIVQCTGGPPCTWGSPLGGTFLNRTNSTSPYLPKADSISAVVKGTSDILVAWSEYSSSDGQSFDSPPNIYVTCWCSGALVPYGGSLNIVPGTLNAGNPPSPPNSGDSARMPAIRYVGGQPYVAFIEIANSIPLGIPKLYIRTSNNSGATWTTLVGPLNIDSKYGWPYAPSMTDDGATNLYISWIEQSAGAPWTSSFSNMQGALGSKPHNYSAKVTTSGVVTRYGGTMNADLNGAAATSRIALLSGAPIGLWSEANPGTTRQLQAKQWNGTDWSNVNTTITLNITSTTPMPPDTISVAYSQTLSVTGGTSPYTWSLLSGTLPTGLTLHTSTGVIDGTPTVAGTYNFTIKVTDNVAATDTQPFTLVINPALSVTTTSLPGGSTVSTYSQTLTSTGGTTPVSWSVTVGSLPTGLSLIGATISGMPTSANTYNFTVQAMDNVGALATKALSIVITTPPPPANGVTVSGTVTLGGVGVKIQ